MPRITTLTTPLGADAFGDDILAFRALSGSEGLSTLFDYTLSAHSSKADIDPTALLGKPVTISLQDQHGDTHHLNAIVRSFERQGRDDRYTLYEAKLVPWLWLATRREDCKIFQNMSVVEIIDDVLADFPFLLKKKLFDSYPKQISIVQYNEDAYAFVSRLMEFCGIYYYFEHSAEQHTLVLCDYLSAHKPVPGHAGIPFCAPARLGIAKEETIHQWTPVRTLKTGQFVTADYDYRYPDAQLEQRRSDPQQHAHDDLESYHWHGQGHYSNSEDGAQIGRVRLEQHQHRFDTTTAAGNVRG